jgi:hypothetical protein
MLSVFMGLFFIAAIYRLPKVFGLLQNMTTLGMGSRPS